MQTRVYFLFLTCLLELLIEKHSASITTPGGLLRAEARSYDNFGLSTPLAAHRPPSSVSPPLAGL